MRQQNRQRRVDQIQRHIEEIRKENTERRLTEIDPHWRERFHDYMAAEYFYAAELHDIAQPKHPHETTEHRSYQPPELRLVHSRDPDEE